MARFCDQHYFYDASDSRKKVCKLKQLLSFAIQNESWSYGELARIAGSIVSVALAVGPISRLLTWQMYLGLGLGLVKSGSAWDHTFASLPLF